MKRIERLDLDHFWPLIENRTFLDSGAPLRFSDATGYHIYADLNLNLDLSAAEDDRHAMKCVDILEDFTSIGERCAGLVGARILEVQGERIHFLLPENQPTPESLKRLLIFATAFTRMAYDDLQKAAGDDWRSFSMAADFGAAIFVPSTFAGGSVVSLGIAANRPAKRLSRGVTAGHLSLPAPIGSGLPGIKTSGQWVEIDVRTPSAATKAYFDDRISGQMREEATKILNGRRRKMARSFVRDWSNDLRLESTPYRSRGMCLRADLDGFSKRVEGAFKKGPQSVIELTQQFAEIMDYPVEFRQHLNRPVIEIPWAGDCCTLLIQPRFQESIEEMRASLPVEAGRCWHGVAHHNGATSRWRSALGEAKWALGLACGSATEGGDGRAIISEFRVAARSFRVIVGWCARRAKDAQEADGVAGDSVAIPKVDYDQLELIFQPLFKPLTSQYHWSTYEKLRNAGQTVAKPLAMAPSKCVSGVASAIPGARPYWPGSGTKFSLE